MGGRTGVPPLAGDDAARRTAIRQELEPLTRIGFLREERPDGDSRVYYIATGDS